MKYIQKCKECGGRGVYDRDIDDYGICPHCTKGYTPVMVECPDCKGKGYTVKTDHKTYQSTLDCSKCKGTGKVPKGTPEQIEEEWKNI